MQVRENLNISEGPPTESSTKCWKKQIDIGITCISLIVLVFIFAIVTVGILTYHYGQNDTFIPTMPLLDVYCRNYTRPEKQQNNSGSEDETRNNNRTLDKDVRLPLSVLPVAYDIRLIPFLIEDNFTFAGEVKIRVKVVEDCFNITLHTANLDIRQEDVVVGLIDPDSKEKRLIPIEKQQHIEESKQFFILHFHETLRKNSFYEIFIKYEGYMMDSLQGLYRSSYYENDEKRWIASTQFQPTDARRAFPCFDEPALKAKFNISIGRPKNMSSISNMPKVLGESQEIANLPDYVWDVFQESVPMSTYLVAFIVCDFQNRTNGNFAVWARNDEINSAEYALQVGPKILKFLEEFFDIPFPLPKMDMIALPDFQAGAMENWGLITFRETAMLYDPKVSASGNRQRVATVVAHELAHQWFGNLVTPSWWSDIWLNEGFASYIEYLGVDAIEPNWKPMEQFVINELQNVFVLDALSSSHKISIEVGNPDEINEIFDRISYAKGAAIIRMMSHFLTTDVFRSGLANYLKKMSYDSAEQDDLWEYLTKAAHKHNVLEKNVTVKEIMDTWTLQKGFPLVTIERNPNGRSLTITQERFAYEKIALDKNETEALWWIPLTFATSNQQNFNNTRPSYWLRKNKSMEVEDIELTSSTWYIFNTQQTAYYRVQYDERNWQAIIAHLRDSSRYWKTGAANRAQLIDDALNLARAGLLNYNTVMDLTLYLEHEADYVPLKAAITSMNFIDSMFVKEGDYHLWQKYLIRLLKPAYQEVGFNETGDEGNMLKIYKRIDILTSLCHLGYKDCIQKCNQQYHNWMTEPNPDSNNPISPNLKNIVYCNAIRYGTEDEWDFAFQRFLNSKVSSERELILSSLGCSRETWILNRYLRMSLDVNSRIRKQDVFRVFNAVSNNVMGQPIAFNYIRKHWREMKKYLGSSIANLNVIVRYSTQRMNTEFELNEVKTFIDHSYKEGGRVVQQAIERIKVDIKWMKQNYKTIVDWLRKEMADYV